jgi:hypothetical protein
MKSNKVICCFLCFLLVFIPTFAIERINFDLVRLFDQYGNIPWKYEKRRLDNLAKLLINEPKVVTHIIVYAGQRYCPKDAPSRARRAKDYLINVHGISYDRVIWREGGHREDLTVEIYIKLRGEAEPSASPTLGPSDVQIIKSCKRSRRGKS